MLRMRPTASVGEVARRRALDLLKAWNTGLSGFTHDDHADSAKAALLGLRV